jgi:hypothetical protein
MKNTFVNTGFADIRRFHAHDCSEQKQTKDTDREPYHPGVNHILPVRMGTQQDSDSNPF